MTPREQHERRSGEARLTGGPLVAPTRRGARRRAAGFAVLVMVVFLLPTLVVQPAGAQFTEPIKSPTRDGTTYEWWNEDWHFRVPVIVRPRLADEVTAAPDEGPVWSDISGVTNYPVRLELDFTDIVSRIGADGTTSAWPRDDLGRLSSFSFDPASVRVVAYDRDTGKIEHDLGEDGELASRFVPRLLENPDGLNPVFNASSNAVGTVFFILPGTWTTQQLVFVYFDIEAYGTKEPLVFPPEDEALLDGLHWTRWGTTFTGYVPRRPDGSKQPGLAVIGILDNTTVAIRNLGPVPGAGLSGGEPLPLCEREPSANPCVEGGRYNIKTGTEIPVVDQFETIRVAPSGAWFFRIDATKPVLVFLDSPSADATDLTSVWYPSLDGGVVGTRFTFESVGATKDCSQCDGGNYPNTLRIISLEGRADVSVSQGGPTRTCTVARGAALPLAECDGRLSFTQNTRYSITSNRRIAVVSTGATDSHALQAVDAYGRPFGKDLYVPVATLANVAGWEPGDAFIYSLDPSRIRQPASGTSPYGEDGSVWSSYQTSHQTRGEVFNGITTSDTVLTAGMWGMWAAGGKALGMDVLLPLTNRLGVSPYGLVLPLYDDTSITIRDVQTGEVIHEAKGGVGDGVFRDSRSDDNAPIIYNGGVAHQDTTRLFRITSTKPVAVYGYLENGFTTLTTFYSGRVAMPDHEVGVGGFHGCLVGWVGDKSLSGTFTPGDVATFKFRVANLGKGIDGPGADDSILLQRNFRFDIASPEDSWRESPPSIAPNTVSGLPAGEAREITVSIPIPADATTGDIVEVDLLAQSGCEPDLKDAATARVTVKTRYALDMKFSVTKRREITRSLAGNDTGDAATLSLDITVTNLGTGNDSFEFRVSRGAIGERFGFEAMLYDRQGEPLVDADGNPLTNPDGNSRNISIARGSSAVITLFVQGPSTSEAVPEVPITVGGESRGDASARDQVTATVLLNAERSFQILVEEEVLPVAPGRNATFNLTIVNQGIDADADVSFVAALNNYPGWNVSLDCGDADCAALPLRSAGSDGDRRHVNLTVAAGEGAPVGTLLTLKVLAGTDDDASTGSAAAKVLTTRVVNNFDVAVLQGPPRTVSPGEEVTFDFILDSSANGALTAEVVPTSLPSGWRLLETDPTGTFPLNTTEKPVIRVVMKVRDNEAPGGYGVGLGLILTDDATRDRIVRRVNFSVNVQRVLDVTLTLPEDLQAPPGGTVRVPVLVKNTGNDDVSPDMSIAAPGGWTAALLDQRDATITLEPGASQVVNYTVRAPEDRSSGPGAFMARASIPFEQFERSASFTVNLLRRDLVVEGVSALTQEVPRVGRTAAFQVTVLNNGTRAAANVELAIVVDDKVASNLTIRSLPAGEAKNFTLAWTVTSTDAITVVVDPRGVLSDDDPTNNALTVNIGDAARGPSFLQRVPPAGAGITFLSLLGVALLMAKGRRRGP